MKTPISLCKVKVSTLADWLTFLVEVCVVQDLGPLLIRAAAELPTPHSTGTFSSTFFFVFPFIKKIIQLGVVAHTFNPSTGEAEAGRFLSSRSPWSTE
jgi:major histocompatibility complex class I